MIRKASSDLTTEISKELNEIKDEIGDKGKGEKGAYSFQKLTRSP